MNYGQALAYLERLGNEVLSMRFGLETIRALLSELGNPQLQYPSVLIAGTNGKGSVARFLSTILTASGRRTALYTSPHLVRLEERCVIDDRPIAPEELADSLTRVVAAIERLSTPCRPTYFETLTALAFLYFAELKVEIAVLEVGMGGRLDSTNVVDPLLSILTPIGLDHQQYLGESLEQIAAEKAGIIHPGRPVLSAPQRPAVRQVIAAQTAHLDAPLIELDEREIRCVPSQDGIYCFSFHGLDCRPRLYGRHQVRNAALAVQAAEVLSAQGYPLGQAAMEAGIREARLGGRIQKLAEHPAVFLDGAHNPDAARNLTQFLCDHTAEPRSLVFGMMGDKDLAGVAEILRPHFTRVYLSRIHSVRAATIDDLARFFPTGVAVDRPCQGLEKARQSAATVVATGSFYLVGEILREMQGG